MGSSVRFITHVYGEDEDGATVDQWRTSRDTLSKAVSAGYDSTRTNYSDRIGTLCFEVWKLTTHHENRTVTLEHVIGWS